jgi:hypothetical protein
MLVTGEMPADLTNEHDGKPLRVVTSPELATAAVWMAATHAHTAHDGPGHHQ